MSTANLPWHYRWVHTPDNSKTLGELQVLTTYTLFGIRMFKTWKTVEYCYQENAKHYAERHYQAQRASGMEFTVQ